MDNIYNMPGFDTMVDKSDGHKKIREKYQELLNEISDEWSRFKDVLDEKFKALGKLIDREDNRIWDCIYVRYHEHAIGEGKEWIDEDFQKPEFMKYCEQAMLQSKRKPTTMKLKKAKKCKILDFSKKSKQASPKIRQKPFLHKRKKIDFKMSDIENEAEDDDDDSDFVE